jgi:DNA-binding CsgD family transcriptional regulator
MDIIPYDEARKIWHRIARTTQQLDLPVQADLHKKFMNIFQVGSYYHYIFNCVSGEIEYADDNISNVVGYTPDEFTVALLISKIHPDDLPHFLNFENEVTNFFGTLSAEQVLKYKVRYDYRVLTKAGNYIRLLQQVITIQSDENGAVLRTMGVHTDVTLIKPDGTPQLSFIGLDGEPSYHDVAVKKVYTPAREVLTRREKEILAYMAQGYKSPEISAHLNISTQTVITHRKNMLGKTATGSAAELVMTALKEGWI